MKVFCFLLLSFFSVDLNLTENNNTNILSKPEHIAWNNLLQKHVDQEGNVNYTAFQKDVKSLESYLDVLALNSPRDNWSRQEKLAYYINLYNAATVKLILDNYPTESIKDIRNPWDKEWVKIGAKTYSLGQIEHKILRKMSEPRIHFAINCASYSCPKLLNEAYTSANLETQLRKATFDFINDPKRNKITIDKLQLSHIFKWYKSDFTENASLIDYIAPYTKIKMKPNAKINYLEYNWNLNEIK
tara:strand:- start:11037 stop:11768 length:732 start_codon:yes stop_codon:yes gene_type:complete